MAANRIAGRECGGCTVCCTVLPIETPELRKVPGVACQHCADSGCAIYETRFPICRTYFCGWHSVPLGPEWRPDQSGVLISSLNDGLPEGYRDGGIEFLVLKGEEAIRRHGFVEAVTRFILGGAATYLAFPGPVGHYSARVLVNDALHPAIARRDRAGVLAILLKILASAANHSFAPATDYEPPQS